MTQAKPTHAKPDVFGKLNRSLDAFKNATPEQDGYTVGAACFFDVDYADVTPQQRAAWKWTTEHMRSELITTCPREPDFFDRVVDYHQRAPLREQILNRYPGLRGIIEPGKASP